MKICFVALKIFAWGKHGGLGRATRMIEKGLAKKGVTVTAVTPLRGEQEKVEYLGGVRVLGFPRYNFYFQSTCVSKRMLIFITLRSHLWERTWL